MSDEHGPWKQQWHQFVEGRSDLGGADADFLDMDAVLNAPKNEAAALADLENELLATPDVEGETGIASIRGVIIDTITGVLTDMQHRGIDKSGRVLATFGALCSVEPPDATPGLTMNKIFYRSAAEGAETLDEASDWKTLEDISYVAELIATMRILKFYDEENIIEAMFSDYEQTVAEMELTDDMRAIFEQMIEEARS